MKILFCDMHISHFKTILCTLFVLPLLTNQLFLKELLYTASSVQNDDPAWDFFFRERERERRERKEREKEREKVEGTSFLNGWDSKL